jgi:hypothetical protein
MAIHRWYEIHNNGGTATFARYTAERLADGETIVGVFEKMQVDTSSRVGSVEIFGREEFSDPAAAALRLAEAQELQR